MSTTYYPLKTELSDSLDPPLLRSPLYTADAMVLLCPHLIDSISGSLPADAWEWESTVLTAPAAPVKEEIKLERKDDKILAEAINEHLCSVKDKRGHIIAELYKTERNYCRDLDIIINVFNRFNLAKIFRNKLVHEQIVSEIAIKNIFAGMDDLFELHATFLNSLEVILAVDKWTLESSAVGKLFAEQTSTFDSCYTNFIDSYALSQKEMKNLESDNPAGVKFLAELTKLKECNRQSLKELLITPIQRTTRYHLFLKELDEKTPQDHPDKEHLKAAWSAMTNLAKIVNDKKRNEEERTGLFEAFEQTKNCPATLINSRRRMILGMDALEVKSNKSFHLFLCSDLLMITSNAKASGVLSGIIGKSDGDKLYKFIKNLELRDLQVEEMPDNVISVDGMTFKFDGYDGSKNKRNFMLALNSSTRSNKEAYEEKLSSSASSVNNLVS